MLKTSNNKQSQRNKSKFEWVGNPIYNKYAIHTYTPRARERERKMGCVKKSESE